MAFLFRHLRDLRLHLHWLTVAAGCLPAVFAAQAQESQSTVLRIFGADSNPPKHYADHGQARGFAFDIAVEAARRAGFIPKPEALPWARALQSSKDGLGIITAFSFTQERLTDYLYTRAAFQDEVVLVHRRGDMRFEGNPAPSLSGRHIGIGRAGRFCKPLNDLLAISHVMETTDGPQRLRLLLSVRIDLAVYVGGIQGVEAALKDAGLSGNRITIMQPAFCRDANHLGVGKALPGAEEIRLKLDEALASMEEDGTTATLLAGYARQ